MYLQKLINSDTKIVSALLFSFKSRGETFFPHQHDSLGNQGERGQTASKYLRQHKYTQKNKHLIWKECSNVFLR